MRTFIHYGHNHFNPSKWVEIQNISNSTKPRGGLWACDELSKSNWKTFTQDADYGVDSYDEWFSFSLKPESKLLTISSLLDVEGLPTLEHTSKYASDDDVYLDFEALAKQYDVVEILASKDDLYFAFYGWDIDSILVMNKDVIQEINFGSDDYDNYYDD